MKNELASSALVGRKSLPRTLSAAGAVLLATVCASSAATQDPAANEPGPALATASNASVQETLRGTVASANERADTLTIQVASTGASGDFKVRDGLIFNAVRYGDPVEIIVETIGGVKTIVALTKQ